MRVALLMFVAGSAAVSLLPALPDIRLLWGGVPLALACLPARSTRWLGVAGLGIAWALLVCSADMSRRLPRALEGKRLIVTGVVASLPREDGRVVQFRFDLGHCGQCWSAARIKLTWYRPPWRRHAVRPGEVWRFAVRLHRPHGSLNPGLFDYQGWLAGKGIAATGYVVATPRPQRLAAAGLRALHHQLRYWLRAKVLTALPDTHIAHLLVALTVGESGQVSAADWQVLSDTGTNHLMVISGLHIGLVAGIAYRVLSRLLAVFMASPARWAGLLSLLTALFYGAIAGFGLPVQRALVMATVAFSGTVLNRKVSVADMYCLALFLVTLLDPLAVLSTGFWLSFGAVFALLYTFTGRIADRHAPTPLRWVGAALRTQWAVLVGMVPLLMYFVFQVSLVAFFVNLVAIPWIGLLVIPLLLLAIPALVLGHGVGAMLLGAAAASLGCLWRLLAFAASGRWVYYASDVQITTLALALVGALLILSPRGMLPRWLGVVLMLPLFAAPPSLAPGEVIVRVLDVGEASTAIVRSRDFRVVYLATPPNPDRFDISRQIVTPMLRRFGAARYLGAVVLGEGHLPRGDALHANFVIGSTFAHCDKRRQFARGRVHFVLLPSSPGGGCALLVQSGGFAILLPGNIQRAGEHRLMSAHLPPLSVLVAPGNGRRGSSGPAFLNVVHPAVAVFSSGYHNRFGHPNKVVVRRYRLRGIRTYNTADDGAILIHYSRASGLGVSTARGAHARFWYD